MLRHIDVRLAAVSLFAVLFTSLYAQDVPLVSVEKVKTSNASVPKVYVGQIVPIYNVELVPRVTGVLRKTNFQDGSMVKKGDVLFEIEDTTYAAKVLECEAKLVQCKATEAYASKEYYRNKKLREKNAVAVTTFESMQQAYEFAKAGTQAAMAALIDAKNNLSYTKIYSPITGRAGKVSLSPGNLLTPSTGSLCTVVSLSPIRVKFALSEPVFNKEFGGLQNIRKTAIVQVKLADGTIYPETGTIEIVDNQFNTSTNTVRIWANFKNKDLKLFPGGFATVLLAAKNQGNLTRIPAESVITRNDGTYVYVVDNKMVAHIRKVELGNSAVTFQEIISGLKPGETVIKYGTHKVTDGKPIRVK